MSINLFVDLWLYVFTVIGSRLWWNDPRRGVDPLRLHQLMSQTFPLAFSPANTSSTQKCKRTKLGKYGRQIRTGQRRLKPSSSKVGVYTAVIVIIKWRCIKLNQTGRPKYEKQGSHYVNLCENPYNYFCQLSCVRLHWVVFMYFL